MEVIFSPEAPKLNTSYKHFQLSKFQMLLSHPMNVIIDSRAGNIINRDQRGLNYQPFPMYSSLHCAVVLLSFLLPFAKGQSTQDIAQLFSVDRIVPDLLPTFNPTLLLKVSYSTTVLPGQISSQNGANLKLYLTNFLL